MVHAFLQISSDVRLATEELTVPQDLTYHKQWCNLNVHACNVFALLFNHPGDKRVRFSAQ